MCNQVGAGGGLSPQIAQLLNNALQTQQSPLANPAIGGMDPLAQLQQFMGQMGQTGGPGPMDMRALRHIIRQLDRQIVDALLQGGFSQNALQQGLGMPGAATPGLGAGIPGLGAGIPGMDAGIPGMGAGIPGPGTIPGMDALSSLMPQGIPNIGNCFPPDLGATFPQAINAQPPCGAPPPPCAAPPPPPPPLPEIKGDKKGGWLADHGKYTKNDDGSYSLPDGRKVVPVPNQKGQFNVLGPDGQPQGIYNAPGGADKIASPLTLDLNGDGKVSSTGVQNGKKFDINGDGKVDQTAWAGAGDGVLAFGNAASGKELLGNNTDLGDGKKYANGFEALRALADKYLPGASADGKLDANELAQLQQKCGLSIIVDGQRKSLTEAGVKEINLGYTEAGQAADENGNQHRQIGAGFVRTDDKAATLGRTGKVDDVWFKYA